MITLEVTNKSITANGHAKEQLICNSVSVLLWGLCVSLDHAGAYDLEVSEDDGYQQVIYTPTEKTAPIFNGVVEALRRLAGNFPTEVKIFEKK